MVIMISTMSVTGFGMLLRVRSKYLISVLSATNHISPQLAITKVSSDGSAKKYCNTNEGSRENDRQDAPYTLFSSNMKNCRDASC